jgi:hypothetical protein
MVPDGVSGQLKINWLVPVPDGGCAGSSSMPVPVCNINASTGTGFK